MVLPQRDCWWLLDALARTCAQPSSELMSSDAAERTPNPEKGRRIGTFHRPRGMPTDWAESASRFTPGLRSFVQVDPGAASLTKSVPTVRFAPYATPDSSVGMCVKRRGCV